MLPINPIPTHIPGVAETIVQDEVQQSNLTEALNRERADGTYVYQRFTFTEWCGNADQNSLPASPERVESH